MRLLLEAATRLNLANAEELAETDGGSLLRLDTLLAGLGQSMSDASNALAATYFTHAERPYQLVEEEP